MADPISVEAGLRLALSVLPVRTEILNVDTMQMGDQSVSVPKALLDQVLAALANDAQSVPEGMVLVPSEPTEAMLDAGQDLWLGTGKRSPDWSYKLADTWSAMIAATHPEAVSQVGELG